MGVHGRDITRKNSEIRKDFSLKNQKYKKLSQWSFQWGSTAKLSTNKKPKINFYKTLFSQKTIPKIVSLIVHKNDNKKQN